MSDGPEWFRPKRYGFGATPVTWQGWALILAFVAIFYATVVTFRDRPLTIAAILVPLLATFITITAKTTRGGWRWRWGKDD
jgi:hypothetical protein